MTDGTMKDGTGAFMAARDILLAAGTDYDRARREFRWPDTGPFNWALDYFDVIARDNPQPALRVVSEDGSEETVSYAEMAARSARTATWLRGLGVGRGDRILLMLPNIPPLWEVMLAAMKLGAVVIPATTLLAGEELRDRVERGGARFVIVAAGQCDRFDDLPGVTRIAVGGAPSGWIAYEESRGAPAEFSPDGETRPDDPMLLYFTSGTTAKPKLVLHTHRSYPVGHLSTMYWIGLRPEDVHWNISSPGWAKHAWSNVFAPWNAQATVFVYNYARFQARAVLDVLVGHGVTTLCAPPTVWRMLIQEDLKSWPVRLREVVGAGEPLNAEVIEQVRSAWGLTVRDGFGQTETTAQVGNSPGQPVKPGSMGRPLPGYDVVLLDADGNEAEEGEIALRLSPRPAGLMAGYQSAAGEPVQPPAGGWYRTGDVASRDADGYLTYVGRADDVFKASDYRISPFELESALIEHPAVAEAAVVPSPDPVRLAVPKAFLVLAAGYEPDADLARDIFRHIRATLPPYKRVRRIEFADLPKTISGKIRRVELRREEQGRADGDGRHPQEFWEEDFPDLR
ncbi:AMP-binding protein [Rhodospirillum centenum]|uniref:Acetyl-CoA synthetase, putative n=1 Tax=Rhodospirillum centenum (strain ATCC 51521 / SW) TaxID=414684 RepID=B6IVS3_RHOCS|nr:AMP-binding protein [Rhodospirillum centenum]ACJ00397.1 acetyl-CoA synthetase, putative [Rhodospirillum centenum SW]